MSDHIRNTNLMLVSPRCDATTRSGSAQGSGAPRANQNARKHGLFSRDAIAERKVIQALLGDTRRLLGEMK